jgi:hypothetical protein
VSEWLVLKRLRRHGGQRRFGHVEYSTPTHGERNTPCWSTARSYPRTVAAAVDELTLS